MRVGAPSVLTGQVLCVAAAIAAALKAVAQWPDSLCHLRQGYVFFAKLLAKSNFCEQARISGTTRAPGSFCFHRGGPKKWGLPTTGKAPEGKEATEVLQGWGCTVAAVESNGSRPQHSATQDLNTPADTTRDMHSIPLFITSETSYASREAKRVTVRRLPLNTAAMKSLANFWCFTAIFLDTLSEVHGAAPLAHITGIRVRTVSG